MSKTKCSQKAQDRREQSVENKRSINGTGTVQNTVQVANLEDGSTGAQRENVQEANHAEGSGHVETTQEADQEASSTAVQTRTVQGADCSEGSSGD